MSPPSAWLLPRTLFRRTALVIALVSVTFEIFTLSVITYFALVPLGRDATDDFAALMVSSAQSWQAAPAHERAALNSRFMKVHRIAVRDHPVDTNGFTRYLPYFHFLETALSNRTGLPVRLGQATAEDGSLWYWARLPASGTTDMLQVGFPASRVAVQPSAALLIIMLAGALVTFLTAAWFAHWLIRPLAQLATATQRIGKGQRPAPLSETGPTELATLAREFNRMGEEVEALLANRTTLLAGISHDLRSPLARIRLALGMLAEKPDADLLERIMRDVENMNLLIARCLEVGRDFAERDSTELNLCDLLSDIAREHAASAEIRGRKGPDCHLCIRPLALRRILSNLVDNAVRYSDGQPIDIEYDVDDGTVEIRVLDRGTGIPESEREAVFQPFRRLDPSRSSRTGGSGLGLAIVRQIALANGWSVTLDARPGGGTIARVRLPISGD
jgi:two-component system, OmpR family, osmolarity sensor histidine kinase EnvZ